MTLDKLKVYPSGFLGSALIEQTTPIDVLTVAKQLFNSGLSPKNTPFTASSEIVDLWFTAISGSEEFKTFEYKEKVLKFALKSFGTDKLLDWVEVQYKNPEFTDTHSKWIDETISFVGSGKPRELTFNNWTTILSAGSSSPAKRKQSPIIKDYFFSSASLLNKSNITIKKFILSWVRQNGGIEDLLYSLNMLYGKR